MDDDRFRPLSNCPRCKGGGSYDMRTGAITWYRGIACPCSWTQRVMPPLGQRSYIGWIIADAPDEDDPWKAFVRAGAEILQRGAEGVGKC